MSFSLIAMIAVGVLFGGSLWWNIRQTRDIAELNLQLTIKQAAFDNVKKQLKILTDRDRKSTGDRLSDGSF